MQDSGIKFHGRLENAWSTGLVAAGQGGGWQLFEASGVGVNADVGAAYGLGRMHYGMLGDPDRKWTRYNYHDASGTDSPVTIPGYGERNTGGYPLIDVDRVTGYTTCRLRLHRISCRAILPTTSAEEMIMDYAEEFVDLLTRCRAHCLWFIAPDRIPAERATQIYALECVERYGGRDAFIKARELKQWLLQHSNEAFAVS